MNKSELIQHLEEENRKYEAFLAQIRPDRMDQPGVAGHWSVKDIVAHVADWRKRTVARLEAAARGASEPPPFWPKNLHTDDEINNWMYEANKDRSVQEVLDDSRRVFQQLVAAIDALPETDLNDPNRFPWLEGQSLTSVDFFSHFHEEHEPDLRAWLSQQVSP